MTPALHFLRIWRYTMSEPVITRRDHAQWPKKKDNQAVPSACGKVESKRIFEACIARYSTSQPDESRAPTRDYGRVREGVRKYARHDSAVSTAAAARAGEARRVLYLSPKASLARPGLPTRSTRTAGLGRGPAKAIWRTTSSRGRSVRTSRCHNAAPGKKGCSRTAALASSWDHHAMPGAQSLCDFLRSERRKCLPRAPVERTGLSGESIVAWIRRARPHRASRTTSNERPARGAQTGS